MNCKKCNNLFEPSKGLINYCSLACRNSREWKDADKLKKSISALNSEKVNQANSCLEKKQKLKITCNTIEYKLSKSIKAKSYFFDNPKALEKFSKSRLGKKLSLEQKNKLSIIKKEYYKTNPEKHPNRLCAGIKESYPEKMVREYLEQKSLVNKVHFIQQYKINKYFIDFYFPKINMGLEIDGERWHTNNERELIRENKVKEEINLIRFMAKNVTSKKHQLDLDKIIADIA